MLNLCPKLFCHRSLLRTKNAACEIESIFLGCGSPSQSLLRNSTFTVFWHWFLQCVEDPAAKWICSARPKQETVRRPEGDLCLEWESRLSCGICLETHKVLVCVSERDRQRDFVRWSHWRLQREGHANTLTYRLYCHSICVPLAVQFEGVGRCVPWTECMMVVFKPSLFCTPNYTHTLSPTACIQARTFHNIRGQQGHKEVNTWQTLGCWVYTHQLMSCCFTFIIVTLLTVYIRSVLQVLTGKAKSKFRVLIVVLTPSSFRFLFWDLFYHQLWHFDLVWAKSIFWSHSY